MKKYRISSLIIVLLMALLGGCAGKEDDSAEDHSADAAVSAESEQEEGTGEDTPEDAEKPAAEPTVEEMDWSAYFDGLNGAAVIYEPEENRYQIYNQETAQTRRPPCSTFKIISSAIGLENEIIEPDDSVRPWSGEIFWNEDWNRDIGFEDAFRTSCVWYFREVVDEIGKDLMQQELDQLQYGNCDISDWEGRLNTNTDNPAMTGFWIESSLLISPVEQTEVMDRIFREESLYSKETQDKLKEVMLYSDQQETDFSIYGKTGLGATEESVVDAWFTGFADVDGENVYFCVYLGRTDGVEASSQKARKIAVELLSDVFREN